MVAVKPPNGKVNRINPSRATRASAQNKRNDKEKDKPKAAKSDKPEHAHAEPETTPTESLQPEPVKTPKTVRFLQYHHCIQKKQ